MSLAERIAREVHGELSRIDVLRYLELPDDTATRIATAIIPIINAEIAAERERSAGVAEEYPSLEHADIAVVRGIAAAIRAGAK